MSVCDLFGPFLYRSLLRAVILFRKMIISEEEAAELKTWVVKKLEDMYVLSKHWMLMSPSMPDCFTCIRLTDCNISFSSDADSDVLADYVLALVRADTPEPELRINAIENLEDFLKPSTLLCYVVDDLSSSNGMLI